MEPTVDLDGPAGPAPLLAYLDKPVVDALLAGGLPATAQRDDVLLKQGSPPTSVVLIESGWVAVSRRSSGRQPALLAVRGPGDVVGEVGVLTRRPRMATVSSLETTRYHRITAAVFLDAMSRSPMLTQAVLITMAQRLEQASHLGAEVRGFPAMVRVARFLARFCNPDGAGRWELRIPVSQYQLASLVGVSVRTVEAILRTLREEGLLDPIPRRNSLVVLDMTEVRRRAKLPPLVRPAGRTLPLTAAATSR